VLGVASILDPDRFAAVDQEHDRRRKSVWAE
jgi:hypothetical protein